MKKWIITFIFFIFSLQATTEQNNKKTIKPILLVRYEVYADLNGSLSYIVTKDSNLTKCQTVDLIKMIPDCTLSDMEIRDQIGVENNLKKY